MKNKLILLMIVLQSVTGFASRDCDEKTCQHQRTLDVLKDRVSDSSFSKEQDAACPSGGTQVIEAAKSFEGSLLKAQGLLLQLQNVVGSEQRKILADNSKCGECKQKNIVSTVSISRPKDPSYSAICENRTTEGFTKDFANASDAARYTKAVMDGKNSEGQMLRNVCPDPCSYYVYTGETRVNENQIRLNLVVRCGQPRGSLFATYLYSGAVVQQWTCVK